MIVYDGHPNWSLGNRVINSFLCRDDPVGRLLLSFEINQGSKAAEGGDEGHPNWCLGERGLETEFG